MFTKEDVERNIADLLAVDKTNKLQAVMKLYYRSTICDDVYSYWDIFIELLDSKDSAQRTRGLFLVSVNSKWDKDNKLDKVIDKYLTSAEDKKAIIARQCMQTLQNVIPYKKNLHRVIEEKLRNIDYSLFSENMCGLVYKDVQEIMDMLAKAYV